MDFVKKAEQQQKRLAVPEGQPITNFAPAQVKDHYYYRFRSLLDFSMCVLQS